MPILSGSQIKRFTALCGARIPAPLATVLDELGDNDAAVAEFGVEYATQQCEDLCVQGAPGIHFYTLNKSHSTARVLRNLSLARTSGSLEWLEQQLVSIREFCSVSDES